ncbi:MAG: molybdopterin-dependent oxidoreductase [Sphaerochaetaceae bacterium]|nr:molybdopterin-dependent oxidoreductase [Sphaerochaetaceae bacterium]
MTDISQIFKNAQSFLVGSFVLSKKTGRFESSPVNTNENLTIIGGGDFDRGICILGDEVPVFPLEESTYPGQPLYAVFGDTYEDVEVFCNNFKINYIKGKVSSFPEEENDDLCWEFSDVSAYEDDVEKKGYKVIKSRFRIDKYKSQSLSDRTVYAFMDSDVLRIKLATQWPLMVKKEVARILGLDSRKVIIYPQDYYAPYDQLLIKPVFAAVTAAKAAIKTGSAVSLTAEMSSYQPEITADIESILDKDNKNLAYTVNASIDVGAFSNFSSELCLGLLSGLVPPYETESMKINIKIVKSNTPPASMFSDSGYSTGMCFSEAHFGKVTKLCGVTPDIWKLENIKKTELHDCIKVSSQFDRIKDTIKEVTSSSWYSRQYAVNNQPGVKHSKINPFIDYSRGIGLSTGEGTQGFSLCFDYLSEYSTSVTLDEKRQVTISCGTSQNTNMMRLWSLIVSRVLGVSPSDVFFKDINAEGVQDVGPSALSRNVRYISNWILRACEEIAQAMRDGEQMPITRVSRIIPSDRPIADHPLEKRSGKVFEVSGSRGVITGADASGSAVIALSIDPVLLTPVIERVWLVISIGNLINRPVFLRSVRQTASNVISEVCPSADINCKIELDVLEEPKGRYGSATSLVRGLVSSALLSALSQALSKSVTRIPVSVSDIASVLEASPKEDSDADKVHD